MWHWLIHGHFKVREVLGYDKYGFDELGDDCIICKEKS